MSRLMLTFDDGPDPSGTPAVLDALGEVGAHATFFVVAPLAEQRPSLVSRILAAGHTVGVHCDEHVRHTERDAAWGARDLERALGRLRDLGVRPSLWRTPWGAVADWTGDLARRHGLRLVGWDVDTHDWRGDRAPRMLADTSDRLRDGAVVLAHDGLGPGARRSDLTETVAYIHLAAACARERGLTLGAVA